jgi:hypothetical protein
MTMGCERRAAALASKNCAKRSEFAQSALKAARSAVKLPCTVKEKI